MRSSNALRLRQTILVKSSNGGGGAGGLRAEDFTGMAWDAIQKMPTIAEEARQQSVDTEMLLKALLDQGDKGVAQRLITQAGADPGSMKVGVDAFVQKLPKISGATSQSKSIGSTLQKVLKEAADLKTKMGDSFIAVDVLVVALATADNRFTKPFLDRYPVSLMDVKAALEKMRGGKKVTTQQAESSFDALLLYGRDLTEAAAEVGGPSNDLAIYGNVAFLYLSSGSVYLVLFFLQGRALRSVDLALSSSYACAVCVLCLGKTRPRDWAGLGDPPHDSDSEPAHQEQPHFAGGAGRGQDGDCRRAGAAHRERRRAGLAAGAAARVPRHGRPHRGGQVPGGV